MNVGKFIKLYIDFYNWPTVLKETGACPDVFRFLKLCCVSFQYCLLCNKICNNDITKDFH